jgi:hypothetical protein
MTRIELIQGLIDKHGYKSYLEIGVNTPKQPGYSHDSIKIETKHGVDPNVDTTFKMTSDKFFLGYMHLGYDIIFIDGDHTYEQCYRDIKNSLEILNEGGTIVVHDCNPTSEITQRVPRESDAWHGDVWKAIIRTRLEGYSVTTIDTDEGCAIIRKIKCNPYWLLDENREQLLNLISVDTWKKLQS